MRLRYRQHSNPYEKKKPASDLLKNVRRDTKERRRRRPHRINYIATVAFYLFIFLRT